MVLAMEVVELYKTVVKQRPVVFFEQHFLETVINYNRKHIADPKDNKRYLKHKILMLTDKQEQIVEKIINKYQR